MGQPRKKKVDDPITEIVSFSSIGTLESDRDIGVVRISSERLKSLKRSGEPSARNTLVKITRWDGDQPGESITRLARAGTSSSTKDRNDPDFRTAVLTHQIAMQYDDQLLLGINNKKEEYTIQIERALPVIGVVDYLVNHTSPLTRISFFASIWLGLLGAVIGTILGALFDQDLSGIFELVTIVFVVLLFGVAIGRWLG